MKLEVYQQDWMPGFAAFNDDGSIHEEAKAHIALNLAAHLSAIKTGDIERKELPYMIAENIMHEVMHALEAWANVEFNEERIAALIQAYNDKYSAGR